MRNFFEDLVKDAGIITGLLLTFAVFTAAILLIHGF